MLYIVGRPRKPPILCVTNMNRKICGLSVLFALLSVLVSVEGAHVYEMNLVNLTYGSLSDDAEFNMTINQDGLMTINAFLRIESSEFYNQVIVAFDDGTGQYSNIMLNKTLDICKFLTTSSYEPLVQLYYKQLIKHENNVPTSCPLGAAGAGAYYFIRKVELNTMPEPPLVPGSNAYIDLTFMVKESNGQFRNLSAGRVFMNFRKL